jgi:hypothetical protein
MDSEDMRSLRDMVMVYVADGFMEKHLSGNFVNTMKVHSGKHYASLVIPARRYNMKHFIQTHEIDYYPGDASYASQLDFFGSRVGYTYYGNHIGYIQKSIMQALPAWEKYAQVKIMSVTYS